MSWLTPTVLGLLAAGGVLIVLSFVKSPPEFGAPNGWVLGFGLASVALALFVIFTAVSGSPGHEPVVIEPKKDGPSAGLQMSDLERLQSAWSADDSANWPVSETLARMSEISYRAPVLAEKEFRSLGFKSCVPFVDSSMIGYVVSADDVTVIVFRGTDFNEFQDWFANIQRNAAPTAHGAVHSGFHTAYQHLRDQIREIIGSTGPKHLWITGHSLGGALALLCANDFADEGKLSIDGVMTFGQPLMVDSELAHYLNEKLAAKYVRFVNRQDIIAQIDPGYVACGSLVWFKDEGVFRSERPLLMTKSLTGNIESQSVSDANPEVASAAVTDEQNSPSSESGEKIDEITPLSEEEFQSLMNGWKANSFSAPSEAPSDAPVDSAVEAEGAVERVTEPKGVVAFGASSFSQRVEDHYMKNYLQVIRRHLGVKTAEGNQR
ncbi:MAG: lipase family protein [Planctomycetaceae bacterium]|nr:lipase family protein [Planctomycetaceae bacterium]